jgi:eukaryotic translation initiation factor 2C
VRRSIDNDRRPETKDRLDLSHDKATQTALCKDQEELKPPRRPGYGTVGSEIALRVNRFSVKVGIRTIHHYDVKFDPEPRKTKDNMKIIQTLTEKFSAHLDGSKPAYDGKANLFTAKLLPFTNGEATFHVTLKLDPDDKEEKVFKVVIRWVTDVDVSQLKDVICGKTQSFPFDVLQALDIVIRMTPRLRFHPVGRSVFRPPDPLAGGSILLGQGREVWFGYHQSIRPSMWSLDLTVDVSATAFYEDCSVIGFLCKILNVRIEQFTGQISDRDRTKFLREIKGLKVTITHLGEQKRKYSVIDISHKSADSLV